MLEQVTRPEREPISLQEIKDYLRVDHDADDNRISAMITQARSLVENKTGLSLVECDYRWFVSCSDIALRVPRYPVELTSDNATINERGYLKEYNGEGAIEFTSKPNIIPDGLKPALFMFVEHLYDGLDKDQLTLFDAICDQYRINRGS